MISLKKAKFIHILIMCIVLFLAVDNSEAIIQFFSNAENHIAKLNDISSNGFLINENELAGLEDSGITGSEYSFDTKYYPYYEMLSIEGQILYKQVYANMKEKATSFIPTFNITTDEVHNVMEAVYNDHPEFFWVNTIYTYKYIENDVVVQITLDFNETIQNFDTAKKAFDEVTNRIIENAKKLSSDYEKEKYVHDEILKLASYDLNAPMNQSAYSALVGGKTVCAGYARAFQYIMIELGIPTYYVSGYSIQDHAWNIVLLDDGYYNVDLTWDNSSNSHKYFNLTDNEISITHKRKNLSINLPICSSTTYRFIENKNNSTTTNNSTPTNEEEIENIIPEEVEVKEEVIEEIENTKKEEHRKENIDKKHYTHEIEE